MMPVSRQTLAAVLLLITFAAVPVAGVFGDQPMSAAELDRFIYDWPTIVQYANQRGRALEANPLAFGLIRGYDDVMRYIRDRGWEPERLFEVMARASTGIAALEIEEQMPGMLQELEAQKREIRGNPSIPQAEKQQAIASIDAMLAQLSGWAGFGVEITEEEKLLVRARRDRLLAVLEAE